MKTGYNILRLLEQSLKLSSDLVKVSSSLEKLNKDTIARKILESGIRINTYLFDAKSAILEFDFIYKLEKAKKSATDVLYWLSQTSKSYDYPKDNKLIDQTKKLIELIDKKTYSIQNKCVG